MMKKYRAVAAIIVEKDEKYLLVRKPRKDNAWQFPQGGVDEGESLFDAAERELQEECGKGLKINFSHEKVTEYKYDFPAEFKRHHGKYDGANISFFRATWILGEVEVDGEEIVESRWCEKEEIKNLVEEKYWEVVEDVL